MTIKVVDKMISDKVKDKIMNKKYDIKKVILWIVTNTLFLVLYYYALIIDNSKAFNALKFILSFNFIAVLSMLLLTKDKATKIELRKLIKRSVPDSVNMLLGVIMAAILASHGNFFYAALDIVTTVMQIGYYQILLDSEDAPQDKG